MDSEVSVILARTDTTVMQYIPPAKIDQLGNVVRSPAICYVDDWIKGFTILTAYKAGTYQPGMERDLSVSPTADTDTLVSRIIADYSTIKGVESKHPAIKKPTFREVYEQFLKWKFAEGTNIQNPQETITLLRIHIAQSCMTKYLKI